MIRLVRKTLLFDMPLCLNSSRVDLTSLIFVLLSSALLRLAMAIVNLRAALGTRHDLRCPMAIEIQLVRKTLVGTSLFLSSSHVDLTSDTIFNPAQHSAVLTS